MGCRNLVIVEDELITALALQREVERLGHRVWGLADRAEDALVLVRQHQPDLVLMDINLRGAMDGIETALVLRDEYELPVIFVTAHSDGHSLDRAKDAGPLGYILKPFTSQCIEDALARAEVKLARAPGVRTASNF